MPNVVDDIVADEEGDDLVMDDGEEDDDMIMENPLVDLLVTSGGENIADAVTNGLDRIARQLDAQNKIFVKLYTVLAKLAAEKSPAAPA